jgi:hypothetical protein
VFVLDIPDFANADAQFLEETAPGGGDAIAQAPFGYMSDTQEVVSIAAVLSVMTGDVDCYELVFFVSKSDPLSDDMYQYWDGKSTKTFIQKRRDRTVAGGLLMACVNELIDLKQPKRVFMATHEAHLPKKALIKYHAICSVFSDKGYYIEPQPSHRGRLAWHFTMHAS